MGVGWQAWCGGEKKRVDPGHLQISLRGIKLQMWSLLFLSICAKDQEWGISPGGLFGPFSLSGSFFLFHPPATNGSSNALLSFSCWLNARVKPLGEDLEALNDLTETPPHDCSWAEQKGPSPFVWEWDGGKWPSPKVGRQMWCFSSSGTVVEDTSFL